MGLNKMDFIWGNAHAEIEKKYIEEKNRKWEGEGKKFRGQKMGYGRCNLL